MKKLLPILLFITLSCHGQDQCGYSEQKMADTVAYYMYLLDDCHQNNTNTTNYYLDSIQILNNQIEVQEMLLEEALSINGYTMISDTLDLLIADTLRNIGYEFTLRNENSILTVYSNDNGVNIENRNGILYFYKVTLDQGYKLRDTTFLYMFDVYDPSVESIMYQHD